MVDTIIMRVDDFSINPVNKLTVQPGVTDTVGNKFNVDGKPSERYLFPVLSEDALSLKEITGAKAYCNGEKINVTIKPAIISTSGSKSCYEDDNFTKSYMFIQASLPRVINEYNLHSLDYEQTCESIGLIAKELEKMGVEDVDLYNAHINRIDSFKNLTLDKNFRHYGEIFSTLNLSRKNQRNYGGDTFLWHNQSKEISIYNKVAEMIYHYDKDISKYLTTAQQTSTIARFENRFLKPAVVRKELGMTTIKDFLTQESYDNVANNFYYTMKANIFKIKAEECPDDCPIGINQIKQQIDLFHSTGKRYWLKSFMNFHGYSNLVKHCTMEEFLETVLPLVDNRMMKSRIVKEWKLAETQLQLFKQIIEEPEKSYGSLYNELREKMFRDVA